ncbi:hypothetical protein KL930_004105 [Ogataea haglerorum]|uniref:ATP-dependent RNA helicase DBP9 n=1 Tax=Ogataea haglerorum TaxID=1937702 RepID=A0ABQ7RMH7_9ASCO|nr:uncharacterized protein KL911_001448 [Ogataea haglerorum]KAG7693292.1 hypothetical protein KL915_004191 [Ogataea haglerorum]KAG7694303.1 hypothetical protein KL951_004181 [Ogataea haglerorum]KAG7712025.1 hypothetical protein KL914_000667 [Ogataea haglerorum]KAG7712797.1 hypothetical protein KL950_000668 [Ogataea haglerorum]KAG7722845.1 hypothetical protein KL913_000665 [Ogataea haglerorum]
MSVSVAQDYVDEGVSFESFDLDARLIQAINKLGFEHPTLIQTQTIKLSLEERKDIIARASTGSGKTAAYCIPIVQSILASGSDSEGVKALVLVPTKELSKQVAEFLGQLTVFCGRSARVLNLNDNVSDQVQLQLLNEGREIYVSTPARLVSVLEKNKSIQLTNLRFLVIDEVDLMVSYGYKDDLDKLGEYLSTKTNTQTFLMSATLNEEVTELKSKFCNKPAVLKLEDVDSDKKKLVQYYIKTSELDKFLLIYVILKLGLIKGKILLFVNELDRGYKLKLFLQNFGIKSCLLNSELPVNSRLHIVEEFNKNVYNLLIATDESNQEGQSNDFGVSRGVDFKNVACVLNFDLPVSSKTYVHRVGRTARGGKSGMALSFVVAAKEWGKHKASSLASAKKDEKVLARIERSQSKLGYELKPYQFNMKQVEAFRYRMEDSFRSVTRAAVRDARLREIKQELMASEKLKRHFEENPQDLATLRHDKDLASVRADAHLKRVPTYLLPEGARPEEKKLGFVPFNKVRKGRGRKRGKKVDVLKGVGKRRKT